jgi:hypothetical protein
VDHQVQKVVLKTDSTGAAAKLNRDEQDRSIHGPLVEQMKSLFQGFGDSSVRAVRRTANVSAHQIVMDSDMN